ncbi:hypothetical protein IV203_036725 [Nitzschia inconspicua]|uniref:Uncharacterized protein n=1 Tax=Nitzschia inconspicua TaxID=303405 RepID=A0A9K3LFQ6_9STRA|nr:hypothetical protein IV203_036725 [Nitzschia inconspicua]
MDVARRSIVEQQSAIAQAQLLAQQQASAVQRSSSYFPPPMLAAQTSLPGYASMQAMMQTPPMVAVAKLANAKGKKDTNSALVVRSSVPRFNVAGGLYTVAQWARKCVEDNLEWIVKLVRRHHPNEQVVMLAYGDGCQTIVLLDDAINQMPEDLEKLPKISIGVSSAPKDAKEDEAKMAKDGVLQPTDSVWDHLRYEQTDTSPDKKEKILFIHTNMAVYGEAVDGRRRVLQVKTLAPKKPVEAVQYVHNPIFEQQLLAKWKGVSGGAVPDQFQRFSLAMMQGMMIPNPAMGMAAAAAHVPESGAVEEEEGTLITFNPKELILLEKAFDNKLTNRDLKSKADKWSEDDKKNCQLVIKRANAEFKWVVVRKRKQAAAEENGPTASKKKKLDTTGSDDKKPAANKTSVKKKANATPTKATKKSPTKKSTPKKSLVEEMVKKEEAPPVADTTDDSDHEPLSKLKEKKEVKKETAVSAGKRKSKGSTKTATTPAKTPAKKSTPASKKQSRAASGKKESPKKKETKAKVESPKKRGRPSKKDAASSAKKKPGRRSNSRSRK